MSGPAVVCIKRKRGDQAPDALLLERPGKRRLNESTGIQYVRQKNDTEELAQTRREPVSSQQWDGNDATVQSTDNASTAKERRTFHLTQQAGAKKRKNREDGVAMATFVERGVKRTQQPTQDAEVEAGISDGGTSHVTEAPLKRPGRRAAVNGAGKSESTAVYERKDQGLANELHAFAEQVVASETKPKLLATPKLSGTRSRELHMQSMARNGVKAVDHDGDADMEDEADYVYDTYVLAPSSGDGAIQVDGRGDPGSVGYLVIADEDQDVWETYLEDEPSDKDWNSDEDDENAEDWYGADYPDDEMASDDEFGRGEHGYRARGAADDEEWDEDTGEFSDEEYERRMNPWRKQTPRSFARYLNGEEETDGLEKEVT